MGISAGFIKRPVATTLLTVALCAAGAVAYGLLPVAPLPQVDFPTISVTAKLPGAGPKTMATSVAAPLERSIGSIAGITEMTSSSTLGQTRITIQFDLNRNIDGASRDVQAAIDAAMSDLPANLPNNPTYKQVNPADAPIMLVALTSDTVFPEKLYDLASTILAQKVAQVSGVGEVDVGGGSLPAVRVEMDTARLHSYGVSMAQVATALKNRTPSIPLGTLEGDGRQLLLSSDDKTSSAADYAPLIVAWKNNSPVRLANVATVRDSVQDINNAGFADGKPAVMLVIYRKPGANIISTVDAVNAMLPRLQSIIPPNVEMRRVFDHTVTIRASLHEVTRTLWLSVGLVILVVFFFLGGVRATIIPAAAIGASLIGTFAGMYLCGFSLDNLSLMALAVATGFVVDDAIVVLENISRHMENGLSPMKAALTGADEVGFTVFSISLSLVAVFIPILLMQGMVGRLFREFAVTLSLAIAASLMLSLTLTPMLCSRLLQPTGAALRGKGAGASDGPGVFGAHLARLRDRYAVSLRWVLRHRRFVLLLWFGIVALTVALYIVVPKGFFPEQDTGLIHGSLRADQSISFQTLRTKLKRLMDIAGQDPAVASVAGFTGSSSSTAFVSIGLKPLSERDATADQIIARLRPKVTADPGAQLFMTSVQDIRVGGRSSRATYQYTMQADDLDVLRDWSQKMQDALVVDPLFKDVSSDIQDRGLESWVDVDRASAARLGVSIADVDTALENAFGQAQPAVMYRARNQYRVVLVSEPSRTQGPEGLDSVYVPSKNGTLVPLKSFAAFSTGHTPVSVSHQGLSAAVTISFNLAPDASLSQATARIEEIRRELRLPASIRTGFQGTAKVFQESLRTEPQLILTALICLFIVLGILYESCVHPITILSTLPPAGIGALLALRLCGMDFSIIALIGVLLLAGIVKKNAILLVDFAITAERNEHLSSEEAIAKACVLRFRPILMTTMAAILGAVPLAIGFGDGSELRRPLGVSIIGGLVMSQLLTLYTTPVIYLYLDRVNVWFARRRAGSRPIEKVLDSQEQS